MHHLHPKSRTTSTLFTTTLAVSFLVVGLPHLLPCPVDRRQFADSVESSDGKVRRRRRRKDDAEVSSGEQDATETESMDAVDKKQRECPVPKPGGLVGQMMGFEQKTKEKPLEVVVRSFRSRSEETPSGENDKR